MVPGLIAGVYERDELAIDLRRLRDQAGVAFVEAKITGLSIEQHHLNLRDRPALHFDWLSQMWSREPTERQRNSHQTLGSLVVFLESEDPCDLKSLRVIGRALAWKSFWRCDAAGRIELQLQQRSDSWIQLPNRCCNGPASP